MLSPCPEDCFVVSAIDTEAGKTLVSALLCLGLDAEYWKPVQAGSHPNTDSEYLLQLTGLPRDRIHPEAYLLARPQSPHAAAEAEGIRIESHKIKIPKHNRPLIIEGAGGLMVPLRKDFLFADLFSEWKIPVILVVRTYLGCINHSLLSLEALKSREIPLAGIVFNEGGHPESEEVILEYGGGKLLGRLPKLEILNRESLLKVWQSWI